MRMRVQGKVSSWKDDRGFGFIKPSGNGDQVFVHISAFNDRSRRPTQGESVSYELTRDEKGRPRAEKVLYVGSAQAPQQDTAPFMRTLAVAGIFLMVVAVLVLVGALPGAIFLLYIAASIVAFLAYGSDKSAARRGKWRTPEGTLHLLGVLGGWPGALIAQYAFRHKTKKRSFVISFWSTVVLNCGALIWLLSSHGQKLLALLIDSP